MFIYLASPYTPKGEYTEGEKYALREKRFVEVCRTAGKIMRNGKLVFCPIAHSHPIEKYGMDGELKSEAFWLEQDYAVLTYVDELWILMLPGWDSSSGVAKEIRFAKELGIPVRYLTDGDVVPYGEVTDGTSEVTIA